MKGKTIAAIIMLFTCASLKAGDTYPILTTLDGTTYKNAEISSVTVTYAIVFWDGGGKKIPLTNFPPELQKKYHFDPAKAEAEQQAQEARAAEAKIRAAKTAAALAVAAQPSGPSQRLRILRAITANKLYVTTANGEPKEIYIHNLPYSVLAFVRDLNNTQAIFDSDKHVQYHDAVGAKYNAAFSRQGEQAANTQHLGDLKAQNRHGEKTTVLAAPTRIVVNGNVPQWEFQGMAIADMGE